MIRESDLLNSLQRIGLLSVAKIDTSTFIKKRRLRYAFSFADELIGRRITFIVGFDECFPLSLPLFFIENYQAFDFIPHVEEDGKVCYTHDDNVFLDYHQPHEIISQSYDLVKKTIHAGLSGVNKIDFFNEFESYWMRADELEEAFGNLKIASKPARIKIGFKDDVVFFVSDENECLEKMQRFVDLSEKGVTYQNGIYFSLKKGYYPQPPRSGSPITFDYFKRVVLDGCDSNDYQEIRKLTEGTLKAKEYVVMSFEQPDGLTSLLAFKFTGGQKTQHPIVANEFTGRIRPVFVQRVDKDYLVRRGGNGNTFFNLKGIVIGCGSVGGFIIEELIRVGFTDLTIVDGDTMSRDNSYRHYLGFQYLNLPKVEGVKKRIEKVFPHSDIRPLNDKIEHLILNKKIELGKFNFIIIATGNVTVNHFLNKEIISNFPAVLTLFAWNEPYGLGGHVLVEIAGQKGCYECLYDNFQRHNKASFASKDQPKPFLKAISGCGTLYTPFSAIDSRTTACMAVRKLIDAVENSRGRSALFSWKGNEALFLSQGYNLSHRFMMSEQQLLDSAEQFVSPTCPACSH